MIIASRSRGRSFLLTILAIGLGALVFAGCGEWPQARLDTYFGQQPETGSFAVAELPKGPMHASLWVLNDTGAPDSAPKLSETAFTDLTEHVRQQLLHAVPIKVRAVHSSDLDALPPEFDTVLRWAKNRQVNYLVLAILSSSEIEVPERFPWRGSTLGAIARGLLFGYRAENLALAELALVDVPAGRVLARVEGNAWASLDRLDPPIESNEYPVVRRNLEDPPIYPEKEADAHDVMRAVAAGDAIDQAVLHLKEVWGRP
ncbi:MAG: hypothetical protein F4090_03960 [Nitrospira sp. SB0672_bin_25]|nr:hypothetical protein [Nitrospira sp. SB0666_bin_27]MYF25132.1 hypothetical protein [Nitrospira sp. SB0678_bin_10]MYJ54050.1 hypothetical protein [Nitrospira sp. SB0672_bin_25]